MGHPSEDTAARRRFLAKTIPVILAAEGDLTLAQLTWHVNLLTMPRRWPCKKRKEYQVFGDEVELVLRRLIKKYLIVKDLKRRKHDRKIGWPVRYRAIDLLTQIAVAACEEGEIGAG